MGKAISFISVSLVTCALALPAGAAARPGDILVGTDGHGTVERMNPLTGSISPLASGAPMLAPSGLDMDRRGFIYTADYDLPGIVRITPGGNATVFATGPLYSEPLDVEVGPDRNLYVAEEAGGFEGVLRVSPDGTTVPASSGGLLTDPYALAVRHRDLIAFVADGSSGNVVRVNLRTGAQSLVSNDPELHSLPGIALAPDGRLYVFDDSMADTIFRIDLATGEATPVATSAEFHNGYNIAVEPRGTLVTAALSADQVARANVRTGGVTPVGPVTDPEGIAVEPPRCLGLRATIVGSTRRDVLRGSRFPDVIASLGGNDRIFARRGNDIVCTGAGADRVVLGRGRDRANAGRGHDLAYGGPGRDRIRGQAGRDRLFGGARGDLLIGGPGGDRCFGGPGRDRTRRC